uniref:Pinin-like n=1 Tax=Ciona intestinalis TaxID=7719 RepID=F7B137_CIOIN|nr:pinin-like [Ciona intestinalis]|eukprot:XP_002131476.1 pinin-like [Ciona intestinalis]
MGQIICCFQGKVENVNEQRPVFQHPAAVILASSDLEENLLPQPQSQPQPQPQVQPQEHQPSENAAPQRTINFTEVKIVNGTFPTKPLERPVAIETERPSDAEKSDNGVTRKPIVPPVDDTENTNSTNNFSLMREQEQGSYSPDIQPDSFSYIDADDSTEPYNSTHDMFPKEHGSPMKASSLQSCSTAKGESMELQQTEDFRPDSNFTEMASPSPAEQRRRPDTMNLGHLRCPENISMQTLNHESTDV